VGEALLLHEVGEDAGVRGQAGDGNADVLVDGEELLLVGGEFFGVALEGVGRRRVLLVGLGWF
jgi:hypothetical protein